MDLDGETEVSVVVVEGIVLEGIVLEGIVLEGIVLERIVDEGMLVPVIGVVLFTGWLVSAAVGGGMGEVCA